MTIKKAIGIGLLGATIIGLVAFGIKTNSFNKENLKPKTLTRTTTPIRVNAEGELTPNSLNWLLNETISTAYKTYVVDFKSGLEGTYRSRSGTLQIHTTTTYKALMIGDNGGATYKSLKYSLSADALSTNYICIYDKTKQNDKWYSANAANQTDSVQTYSTYNARILRFVTEPTGELLAWLTNNATPYYNNNIIIRNQTPNIYQITKNGVFLDNPTIVNTNGTIQLYLYAGITSLYINNTQITNTEETINITNEDVCIKSIGTPNTEIIQYHIQIIYANTLPVIDPIPIPDPSNPVNEIIDIRGLMLQILTMPFTFITQAFDVTLWPNTQYEFNIGNFIMSIIAIASILFIIKLFTSGFSIIGNYTGSRVDTKLKKSQIEYNKAKTDLARRTDPNTKTRINKKEK